MRTAAFVFLALLAVAAGCAGPRARGPYAGPSESERNSELAAHLNGAAVKVLDSNPAKAEQLLRQALDADLFFGPAHNNLGVAHLKQQRLFEAAGEFEWARKLMPGHPDPRLNLALTLERAGRTDEALSTYATALEVYPDHIPTMQAMARLQVRSGKQTDRTATLLREVALKGESDPWRDWARVQMARAPATPSH